MMKNLMFVAALSVAAFAGCKKKGGAGDCDGAATASAKISESSMAGMPEDMKKKASEAGVAMFKEMCTAGKWGSEITDCVKGAKDVAAQGMCMAKLTPEQAKSMQEAMMKSMKAMAPGGDKPADGSAAAPAGDKPAEGSAAPAPGSAAAPAAADGSAAAPAGDKPADGSAAPAPAPAAGSGEAK